MRFAVILGALVLVFFGVFLGAAYIEDADASTLSECIDQKGIEGDVMSVAGDYSVILPVDSMDIGENESVKEVALCHANSDNPEKFVAVTVEKGGVRAGLYTIKGKWSTDVATGDMRESEYVEKVLNSGSGGL
jgi:hypothetical protein